MPLAVSAAVCICVGRSLTLMRSVQQWRPSGAQVGTELSFPCITAPPGLPSLRCGLRAVWVMFSCTDTSDLNSVVCGVLKQKREQPEATSACRTQPVFNQHSSVLSLEQEQQLTAHLVLLQHTKPRRCCSNGQWLCTVAEQSGAAVRAPSVLQWHFIAAECGAGGSEPRIAAVFASLHLSASLRPCVHLGASAPTPI